MALLITQVPHVTYAHQSEFTDVPVTHSAFEQITFVSDNGILTGFPNHSFKPNTPLQPNELRQALVRAAGKTQAAIIWQDLQHAKGGHPLARAEAAVLLAAIARGASIDFKKPLDLAKYSDPNTGQDAPPASERITPERVPSPILLPTTTTACPNAASFFSQFKDVMVSCDNDTLYIQSNGIPDHEMMVGITATNQQVPLPQDYHGRNAWKIPLNPVLAAHPTTTNGGPIGIAVNGVPIFDAHKQGGVGDTKKEGELDNCNGHAGRADDYHYHAAPICLMKTLASPNVLIGYALDGYAIDGFVDSAGSRTGLDNCNGRMEANGYHYHVTQDYPYTIGCFKGVAHLDTIPAMSPLRAPAKPMQDILITKFYQDTDGWWNQAWKRGNEAFTIKWKQATASCWDFIFVNNSSSTSERYCHRE